MAARLLCSVIGPSAVDRLRTVMLPIYDPYRRISYAQEGEDLVIDGLLKGKPIGSYIDVGAHDPIVISNTFRFYRRGWSGLNIDATPGAMRRFALVRPRDINVEAAIADHEESRELHIFNFPGLNTFDAALAARQDGKPNSGGGTIRVTRRIPIRTQRLASILEQHWAAGRVIDFMSIDVEGLGLAVLRSNDWSRYRPNVIAIEIHAAPLDSLASVPEVAFLAPLGYRPVAKTATSLFFKPTTGPNS